MQVQQVEEKVLRVIDAILAGDSVEDSRIECKREWPSIEKARQLAGHANAARGEPIIWIIGIDEKKHQIVEFDESVDASIWWGQFKKRFDQKTAPDLLHNVVVYSGDNVRVVALVFDTGRAPYVINLPPDGKAEKEVPIRKSTGTHSASRDDLLRILVPIARAPEVSIINAQLHPNYYASQGHRGQESNYTSFSLNLTLFFTYSGDAQIFLPRHEMTVSMHMKYDDERSDTTLSCCPDIFVSKDAPPGPRFGVHRRMDGFGLTGSGQQHLQCGFEVKGDLRLQIEQCKRIDVTVKFPIAGDGIHIGDAVTLRRSSLPFKPRSEGPHYWSLQDWELEV